MDGNRRFARKNKLELMNGHSKGFDKMVEVFLSIFLLFYHPKYFHFVLKIQYLKHYFLCRLLNGVLMPEFAL